MQSSTLHRAVMKVIFMPLPEGKPHPEIRLLSHWKIQQTPRLPPSEFPAFSTAATKLLVTQLALHLWSALGGLQQIFVHVPSIVFAVWILKYLFLDDVDLHAFNKEISEHLQLMNGDLLCPVQHHILISPLTTAGSHWDQRQTRRTGQ